MSSKHNLRKKVATTKGKVVDLYKRNRDLEALLDSILQWAIANRGTGSAFISCYTYNNGEFPDWIKEARRLGFKTHGKANPQYVPSRQ